MGIISTATGLAGLNPIVDMQIGLHTTAGGLVKLNSTIDAYSD
jgi:hypothetical protein